MVNKCCWKVYSDFLLDVVRLLASYFPITPSAVNVLHSIAENLSVQQKPFRAFSWSTPHLWNGGYIFRFRSYALEVISAIVSWPLLERVKGHNNNFCSYSSKNAIAFIATYLFANHFHFSYHIAHSNCKFPPPSPHCPRILVSPFFHVPSPLLSNGKVCC